MNLKVGIAAGLLLLGLSIFFFVSKREAPTTYIVHLDLIPGALNPRTINVNTDYFIAAHLFYPLISVEPTGELKSHFLDMDRTKAIDREFKAFELCLQDGVEFSNGTKVEIRHVTEVLRFVSGLDAEVPHIEDIKELGNCIQVRLVRGDSYFLHHLSPLIAAPLADSTAAWPTGLGAYVLEESSSREVRLKARSADSVSQFSSIIFAKHSSAPESSSEVLGAVVDLNHLPREPQTKFDKKNYQVLRRPSFKSYAFVVNYKNKNLRKLFSRCFPRADFAKIQSMPLSDVPGFLPVGVVGAQLRWEDEINPITGDRCRPKTKVPLRVYVYEETNIERIRAFFRNNQKQLPIPVEVVKVEVAELVKAMYTREDSAAVVGFDPVRRFQSAKSEGLEYLEFFTNPKRSLRLVDQVDPDLNLHFNKVIDSASEEEQIAMMTDAHRALLRSGQAIPLGELTRPQIYPKKLSSIIWMGMGKLSGYPDISRMKWN